MSLRASPNEAQAGYGRDTTDSRGNADRGCVSSLGGCFRGSGGAGSAGDGRRWKTAALRRQARAGRNAPLAAPATLPVGLAPSLDRQPAHRLATSGPGGAGRAARRRGRQGPRPAGVGLPHRLLEPAFRVAGRPHRPDRHAVAAGAHGADLVPVGVGPTIYLEEFAPAHRFTRLVQGNIANHAGGPRWCTGCWRSRCSPPSSASDEASSPGAGAVAADPADHHRRRAGGHPGGTRSPSATARPPWGPHRCRPTPGRVLPVAMPDILTGTILVAGAMVNRAADNQAWNLPQEGFQIETASAGLGPLPAQHIRPSWATYNCGSRHMPKPVGPSGRWSSAVTAKPWRS